jgi:hypothetical protein
MMFSITHLDGPFTAHTVDSDCNCMLRSFFVSIYFLSCSVIELASLMLRGSFTESSIVTQTLQRIRDGGALDYAFLQTSHPMAAVRCYSTQTLHFFTHSIMSECPKIHFFMGFCCLFVCVCVCFFLFLFSFSSLSAGDARGRQN